MQLCYFFLFFFCGVGLSPVPVQVLRVQKTDFLLSVIQITPNILNNPSKLSSDNLQAQIDLTEIAFPEGTESFQIPP